MKIGEHFTHPAADVCPMMSDEDLKSLALSIKHDGLLNKIVLYVEDEWPDGRILDGRNRYRASLLAKVEPQFRYVHARQEDGSVMSESELARFIDACNLRRRHMSAIAVAGTMRKLVKFCRERKEREKYQATLPEMDHATDTILSGSDKLIAAVESGEVHRDAAVEIAKLEPDEQQWVLEKIGKPEADKGEPKQRGYTSSALELSDAERAAVRSAILTCEGSVHGIVKAGAAVLRRMVPGV